MLWSSHAVRNKHEKAVDIITNAQGKSANANENTYHPLRKPLYMCGAKINIPPVSEPAPVERW